MTMYFCHLKLKKFKTLLSNDDDDDDEKKNFFEHLKAE